MTEKMIRPGLRISRTIPTTTAPEIVLILMDCPNGPSFQIAHSVNGQTTIWMSQRTYDYLRGRLVALRAEGKI